MTKAISNSSKRQQKKFVVGKADIPPGDRRLVDIDGKSVGVFNVDGEYYAMHNRCPHMAGALCEGPISGTTLPTDTFEFNYGMEDEVVRCGWHGWEFEIKTGRCLISEKIRARSSLGSSGRIYAHGSCKDRAGRCRLRSHAR